MPPPGRTVLLVILVLSLVGGGVVVGQSGVQWFSPGTTTSTYDAPDGPIVTESAEFTPTSQVPIRQGVVDYGIVEFRGPDGSEVRMTSIDSTQVSLSNLNTAGGTIEVEHADTQRVDISGAVTSVTLRNVDLGSSETEIEVGGSGTLDVHGLPTSDYVRVINSGGADEIVSTDSSGVASLSVSDGDQLSLVSTDEPTLSGASPSDGTTVSESPVELSIDVSDADFQTAQGDSVDVTFYDGADDSEISTDTLTANGTATATFENPEGGSNSWFATVSDEYGNEVTTETFTFNAPSEMRIYSETEPSELISDDVPLRVRFFIGSDEEQVIEREATDGTVSLEGLPVDEQFIATVRANDTSEFTYRRIVVDSLIETQDVYLLNRSEPNSEIIYQLDDPTGEFPPEDTVLYVEKPITKDFDGDGTNETRYETIAGDVFGASAQFPVVLQQDTRYRLRVESDSGSTRILGAYSVTGDAVEPLQIQRVQLGGEQEAGAVLTATLEGEGAARRIAIRYRDFDGETGTVEYRVVDERTGEVYVENTTRQDVQQFADFYNLPENASAEESFAVEYTITRDGETRSGRVFAGDLPEIIDRFGVGDNVLRVVSILFIFAGMGLVVIVNPTLAPITGFGIASLLNIVGAFAVPNVVLGMAGAISVLFIVGGGR